MTDESSGATVPGRYERYLHWAADNLHLCWAYVALVMFMLAGLSVPLGVFSVAFDGSAGPVANVGVDPGVTKEVGYLFALNWSLYSVAILPLMAVFGVKVWITMPEVIAALTREGMIRDAEFGRVEEAVVQATWRRVHRGCALLFWLIFACVMLFIMADWWTVVAEPILRPATLEGVTLADPVREFDWSVASLFPASGVGEAPLLVFGFVAYVLIAGMATSAAFATCLSGLFFVAFMCGVTANRRRGWTLVAAPSADDDRAGFGLFSSFFTAFLCLSLTVAVGCLLMVIQNAYLRDPASSDVAAFVFGDISAMIAAIEEVPVLEVPGWVLEWLTEPAFKVYANPQTGVGILLFAFVSIGAVGMSWGLLRTAARSARDAPLANAKALAAETRVGERTVKKRLKEMQLWPIGWMKLNQLVLLIGAILLSLLSYRMVLLPVALVATLGLNSLARSFQPTLFQSRRKA